MPDRLFIRALVTFDISRNKLRTEATNALADALCDAAPALGALSDVNLLGNHIGVERANKLVKLMESHRNLETLCGFRGNETELDLRGRYESLGTGCGVLVANEVRKIAGLTRLNVSAQSLGGHRDMHVGWVSDVAGVQALAAAILECK